MRSGIDVDEINFSHRVVGLIPRKEEFEECHQDVLWLSSFRGTLGMLKSPKIAR